MFSISLPIRAKISFPKYSYLMEELQDTDPEGNLPTVTCCPFWAATIHFGSCIHVGPWEQAIVWGLHVYWRGNRDWWRNLLHVAGQRYRHGLRTHPFEAAFSIPPLTHNHQVDWWMKVNTCGSNPSTSISFQTTTAPPPLTDTWPPCVRESHL